MPYRIQEFPASLNQFSVRTNAREMSDIITRICSSTETLAGSPFLFNSKLHVLVNTQQVSQKTYRIAAIPDTDTNTLQTYMSDRMLGGGETLVGTPFMFNNSLNVIIDTSRSSRSRAGGKSRSKNSYKKYMKKTRKRN